MAQQMVSKSKYVRVQSPNESTVSMVIPRDMADNLGIKKHDTVRVTQEGSILIVRRAVE